MKLGILLIVIATLLATGCKRAPADQGNLKPVISQEIGQGQILLKSATGKIGKGKEHLVVEFRDERGGRMPIDAARISAVMLAPGAAPATAAAEMVPDAPGTFSAEFFLPVAGSWFFSLQYKTAQGADSTSFVIDVQ